MRLFCWACWLVAAVLALVALFAPRPAMAADPLPTPKWIWCSPKALPNETAYLRTTLTLPGKPKKATFSVAADDRCTVFVNAARISEHVGWESASSEEVTDKLRAGENQIAIRANNGPGGPAAVIFHLVAEMTDGSKVHLASDEKWQATNEMTEGWQKLEFDAKDWKKASSLGALGAAPWADTTFAVAGAPVQASKPVATDPAKIVVPAGFAVEQVYVVPKGQQGSWVSMTTEKNGRLICSDQGGALYRITPGKTEEETKIEKLAVNIGQAHGLLYAFDRLYVMVNGGAAQGSGLYQVLDTNGDDTYDEVKLMKKINGGGEHGPHAIRLGPDGKTLYVIAGNHTQVPPGMSEGSPHRNWAEEHLLPRNPDGNGHATGVMAPGGWVVRTDKEGTKWDLFCAGFRNQYDIAFNQDGELFSYDADMEYDTGSPWYRATRINHCASAAEFGWRYGTGKWPAYYVDSVGAVTDIGLGSPTGIEFGTGAKFPDKYQRALFINDWTYGKIYAVHMTPAGASYTATFEPFVTGKPLPVTDVCVHPDGCLYFTIGGRGTQSAMYRVRYTGSESTAPAGPMVNATAAKARELRRKIEEYHVKQDGKAIDFLWPHLNSTDRAIRYAARVALERQDVAQWKGKALAETKVNAAIQTAVALVRTGKSDDQELLAKVLAKLNALPLEKLTEEQLLDAVRAYQLAFIRLGRAADDKVMTLPPATPRLCGHWSAATKDAVRAATERVSPIYPHESLFVNRELCQLLVYLEAPGVADRTLALLQTASSQPDQMHYVWVLRNLGAGWTPEQRKMAFGWLNLAEKKYNGGASFKKFLLQARGDMVAKLTAAEKAALKDVIEAKGDIAAVKLETSRQFQHNWQPADLTDMLSQVEKGRSFEKGRIAYEAAQCNKCHRFKGEGGDTGPDITGVGNRFKSDYILDAIIEPSKVISDQYQQHNIVTVDGEVVTGRVINETADKLMVRTDPFARQPTEVLKAKIESSEPSKLSEMPQGLINVLTKEEIIDLIAYLRSGGDAGDKAFQK